jgi:hypothetical protein
MTYAGLGLTALSFVGTFVIIPSFKQYFKEDVDWKDIYRELSQAGVKTITPEEAARKRGYATECWTGWAALKHPVPTTWQITATPCRAVHLEAHHGR